MMTRMELTRIANSRQTDPCEDDIQRSSAIQSKQAVSAYSTSKLEVPFVFAEQS